MVVVRKYKNGYIVVDEITGYPVIEQMFRTRAQAAQAASEIRRQGYFR